MHIFNGIIGVVIGFLIIKYSIPITDNLGTIGWAEEHLKGGLAGTYSFYRITGVIIIFLSLIYMFGGIGFVLGPLASVFGGVR